MNMSPNLRELESTKRTVKFFEGLLRSTPNGVIVTDLSQNIMIVNANFSSLFNEHWRSIIETNLLVWLHKLVEGAVDTWIKLIESVYRDGYCYDTLFKMVINEDIRYLSVNASLVKQDSLEENSVIISIWRDITKQIEMEEQVAMSERFAILGKLSGSIAHEIRNPLATIDISAFNLKRILKDADEKTKSQINRIIKQVKETTNTIQSLQDLAGQEIPKKENIDLSVIVEEGILYSKIPRDITIDNKVIKNELFVNIDKKQVAILFRNILTNAVEAMDNKGIIRITACREESGWIGVSIKDTGCGIVPENLKNIFQPFFGTKTKGFGFGLAICSMIMEKHGGTLDVQSEFGKGATFIMHFPLND